MALTGYKLEQILGRNCRFLQGPETDPEAVAQVREAIQNGRNKNDDDDRSWLLSWRNAFEFYG